MLKEKRNERQIWLDMIITLLTLEVMAYFYYGLRAAFLAGVCAAVSAAAEFICLRLMHKDFTADDLTCTSDALIIALMLPAVMNYRIAAIACVFAVTAAKNIFGGRNNMIFSPAAAAYVFMMTSWRAQLLQFTEPHVKTGLFENAGNLVSSASHSFKVTGKLNYTDIELLMGNFSGPVGAVSILLLLVAAAILIFRRDISAGAFIGCMGGILFLAYFVPMASTPWLSVKYTLVTNMNLFASIYIVSDKRIAPKRNYYAFFYGLLIGAVSYILVLTTVKENPIVMVSVLFTPAALAFKNLEKRIELAKAEQEENEKAAEQEANKEAEEESQDYELNAETDEEALLPEVSEEEAAEPDSFLYELLSETEENEEPAYGIDTAEIIPEAEEFLYISEDETEEILTGNTEETAGQESENTEHSETDEAESDEENALNKEADEDE